MLPRENNESTNFEIIFCVIVVITFVYMHLTPLLCNSVFIDKIYLPIYFPTFLLTNLPSQLSIYSVKKFTLSYEFQYKLFQKHLFLQPLPIIDFRAPVNVIHII